MDAAFLHDAASTSTAHQTTAAFPIPTIGVPFLEAFDVQQGQAGVLGRLFLIVDDRLKEHGLRLEFATFEEVAALQAKNIDNWPDMNPMFDPRLADIPNDRATCLVVRDEAGIIIATGAGKLFDARSRTFGDVLAAGDFLSLKPRPNFDLSTMVEHKTVTSLLGLIGYMGLRLAAVICQIVNGVMITTWNPDYLMGSVTIEKAATEYQNRYGFMHDAPVFKATLNGDKYFEAALLWSTQAEAVEGIAGFLDVLWPQIDSGVGSRASQHTR
jgi:hypothetical protein